LSSFSIRSFLCYGRDLLEKSGSETPLLDAEILLAKALGVERISLYTKALDNQLREICGYYLKLLKRRARGEPVAYIVGEKEFWSRTFVVNPACLIPRSETELLVEISIDFLRARGAGTPSILDLGTGSGCIAITLSLELPRMGISPRIVASDISLGALKVAKLNAVRLGASQEVLLISSDWATSFRSDTFDLVVSNPPYVGKAELETIQRDIRLYEPREALLGGDDGLRHICTIIEESQRVLRDGGALVMEMGEGQRKGIEDYLDSRGFWFESLEVMKDLSGKDRALFLIK